MKSISKQPINYRFWGLMIAIIVIAAIIRLTGYNFALPYLLTIRAKKK